MGYVSGIAAHPLPPYDIYVRTDAGGAYRLDRTASRWIPLLDQFGTDELAENVESIAFDPTDANTVYMTVQWYADRTGTPTAEALVSHDRGTSWTPLNLAAAKLAITAGAPYGGTTGERLIVDPLNPSRLYYGSQNDGLWIKNGALGWQKAAGGLPAYTGTPGIVFVKANPISGTLYAGVWGSGVWSSVDSGSNWSLVYPAPNPARASIAADGTLFVLLGGSYDGGPGGNVIRYRQGAWSTITPPGINDTFSGLTTDPTDPGVVVVSLNHELNIFRSTDQGQSWSRVSALGASNQPEYYPDFSVASGCCNTNILIDPASTKRLFAIAGYGVLKTDDATVTLPSWSWVMENLEELVVDSVKAPPVVVVSGTNEPGADLLSGVADMMGFRHLSRDAVPSSTLPSFQWVAQANSIAYSAKQPNYAAFVGWDHVSGASKNGFTANNGKTWTPFDNSTPGRGGNVAMSAGNPMNLVWAPTAAPIMYSNDGGKSWLPATAGGSPLPQSFQLANLWWFSQVLVADMVQDGKFYFYSNGDFYSSSDGGATWTKVTTIQSAGPPVANTFWVNVVTNPVKAGDIWIAFARYYSQTTPFRLLHSTDGGLHFTEVSSLSSCNFVAFGKGDSATAPYMYCHGRALATDPDTLYKSTDQGQTWIPISDPTKQKFGSIQALEGDMRQRDLVYVGMGGRGILYGVGPGATTVQIGPGTVKLNPGDSQQFAATVSGATDTSVTWFIDPPLGTISQAGFYTAPATVQKVQHVTVLAVSNSNGVSKGAASVTLVPPANVIRVNAGGPEYLDPRGTLWLADNGYIGGYTSAVTNVIANATAPALYQTDRWYGAPVLYKFSIPNGTYTVTLKFAETYFGLPGQRIMNVLLNGQLVQQNFDILAEAGGPNRAIDKQFTVNVTGGLIEIQLVGLVDNPKVNAIEILPAAGAPVAVTVGPSSVSLGQSQTQQFSATVTGSTNQAVTWTLSPTVGAITASGSYTAPTSITSSQQVVVTATSAADGTAKATAIVTLIPPTAVGVSPSTFSLGQGQSQQFTAAVTGLANTAVTWSLNPAVGALSASGNYTAPASITATQQITITATSVADATVKGTATVTLTPPAGFSSIRVNVGGAAYTDPQGQLWSADTGFTGGYPYQTNTAIPNTTTAPLYQSERWNSGTLVYNFTVPNGTYTVNLKFAEIFFTTPGQRTFNILLNGQQVQSNFDIVAAAGGGNLAIDKAYTLTVSTGQISIQLVGVINNPKISAIEILSGAQALVAVNVTPSTVSLGQSQSQQFTATVTGTGNTAVTWSMNPAVGTLSTSGNYTAPASITATQQITITATSVADGTTKGTAVVTLTPPSGSFTPIRVNAGGAAYTDPQGQLWSADNGFSGGYPNQTNSAISNTTTAPLYQTERWNGGTLTYNFTVPNGSYTVNLKFAEIYFTAAGQRVMNILVNGQQVQSSFDIVSAAGGALRAIDKSYLVTVGTGAINIQLVGIVDNPKINAIEILSGGQAPVAVTVTPSTVSLGQSQSQQFTATVTGTANTAVTWSMNPAVGTLSTSGNYTAPASITATQQITITATSVADGTTKGTAVVTLTPPSGSFTPIRVNAGGAAYTDPQGQLWSADNGFSGGYPNQTNSAISNTTTAPLYQTERWNGGTLNYNFTVPNGTYTVNLKFAEIYFTAAGQRVMNILVNGQQVQSSFDIVSAAGGPLRAIDKSYAVTVSTGAINIQLVGIVDNPKINAIEILSGAQAPVAVNVTPSTVSLGQSQSQQFTATVMGTANTAVTWSMNPAVGTLSTSGNYTAPANITTTQQITITATSVADSTTKGTATVTLTPPSGTFTPIRVNAGGAAYTDPQARLWSADTGFTGGYANQTNAAIPNTTTAPLYQTERWNSGTLTYNFTVPNGSYTVNLKFAEIFFTAAGQRTFNILLNGQHVQSNFDIVAAAGGANLAIDKAFPLTVSTGQISIQLVGVNNNPKISAIEITGP